MEIKSTSGYREITEYIFVFNSGMEMSFAVNTEAGDSIADMGDTICINLTAKPGLIAEEDMLPAEVITIHKTTLAVTRAIVRKIRKPDVEEKLELLQTLHKLGKTIQ